LAGRNISVSRDVQGTMVMQRSMSMFEAVIQKLRVKNQSDNKNIAADLISDV